MQIEVKKNLEKMKDISCKSFSYKPQVESLVYFKPGYDNKGQFCSYWHQINEVFLLDPRSALEIGIGSGFVSNYLRRYNITINTLDFDIGLKPDTTGSVLSIPFKRNAFEVVVCCEVLEHLAYNLFKDALQEIYRICRKNVIMSLPHNDTKKTYRLLIDMPIIKSVKEIISLSGFKKASLPRDNKHFWEIGIKGFPLKKISRDIADSGFIIEKTYRVFEKPYHRFFILKKN